MSAFLNKLKNPDFIQEVIDTLLANQSHSLVRYPRVQFSKVLERKKKRLLDEGYEFKENEYGLIEVVKPEHLRTPADDENDEDFMGPDYLEEEPEKAEFHRRDTFLTGGSVCAVICEKLLGIPAVINDIDLFYYQFTAKSSESLDHEIYENLIDETYNYKISRVKERGLLNLIKIDPSEEFKWTNVLESFDLNCSQVGIILEEKKLICSPEFLTFLENRVIVLNEKLDDEYPLTSFLRATQKSKELNARFYLGDAVRNYVLDMGDIILGEKNYSFKIIHDRHDMDNESEYTELVTKKRWDLWKNNPQMLMPWYSVESEDRITFHPPKEVWFDFMSWAYSTDDYNDFGRTYDLLEVLRTNKSKIFEQNKAFFNRFQSFLESGIVSRWDDIAKILKKDISKLSLFKKDFPVHNLPALKKFLKEHNRLQRLNKFLIDNGYDISEVIETLQHLKATPLSLLGLLEAIIDDVTYNEENFGYFSRPQDAAALRATLLKEAIKSKDFGALESLLKSFLEEDLKKNKLVDGLSIKPFAKYVQEITTVPQIKHEGDSMRHCVGGYAEKVRRGECRIFHIEVNGERSTLEVAVKTLDYKKVFLKAQSDRLPVGKIKSSNLCNEIVLDEYGIPMTVKKVPKKGKTKSSSTLLVYKEVQHKAPCNRVPHKKNLEIARRLIRYLNHYSIIPNYTSKQDLDNAEFLELLFD